MYQRRRKQDTNFATEIIATKDFQHEPGRTPFSQKSIREKEYNSNCKLCGEEKEDIVHFIMKCKNLEKSRDYSIIKKDIKDPEERMREQLCRNKNFQQIGVNKKPMDSKKGIN